MKKVVPIERQNLGVTKKNVRFINKIQKKQ